MVVLVVPTLRLLQRGGPMNIMADSFKETVRAVRAAGKGGIEDQQRVIVRAEPGKLTLIGIGNDAQGPGTEASCPYKYDGETVAVVASLVGLRWLARALMVSDQVDLTVSEQDGVSISITSFKNHGRDATLRSTSHLAPRNPKN